MGCFRSDKPKWKREIVSDHKFENIDLDAFYNPSCVSRLGYIFVFVLVAINFCVYIADFYTAVSLLVIGQTTVTPAIPTEYSKWIFFACIMVSFLLLMWDMLKARRILATRDISFAFTSVIANRYLSMKDYRYYCLFKSINTNSKGIDNYAFFIFFTLKGWKRLLLAEAPRQVINVVTLEVLAPEWLKIHNGSVSFNNDALGDSLMQQILTGTMAFSVLVFALSLILVSAAAILYIPLLFHIRGNLKEYCCHKVDKRISEILRKQGQQGKKKNRLKPETEAFIKENFYKRPLAANYSVGSPNFSSAPLAEDQYEKISFNQNYYSESSPMMTPTMLPFIQSQKAGSDEQRPLGNRGCDESYNHFETPTENINNAEYFDPNFYPRPVAQQLPYQNRYQVYTPALAMDSPAFSKQSVGSPVPSSTCINEERYQHRNYPNGI